MTYFNATDNLIDPSGMKWNTIRAASRVSILRRNPVMRAAYELGLGVPYIAHAARLSYSQTRRIVTGP